MEELEGMMNAANSVKDVPVNSNSVVMDTAVDMTAMMRDDPAVSELYGQLRSNDTLLSRYRRRGTYVFAAITVVVICLVVVFTVIIPGKDSKAFQEETSSTYALASRERFVLIRSLLARVSEPAAFVSPNSPQSEALQWIVYQDETLPIPQSVTASTFMATMTNTTDADSSVVAGQQELERFRWRLVQRYALMVLAFSTSGENWRGIVPWMSHVSIDECHPDFQAVECDQETGVVTMLNLGNRELTGRIPEEIGKE